MRPAPVAALLLALAAASACTMLDRSRLRFTNRLAAPVRLVLAGQPARTVPPGESVELAVPRSASVAEWELVRPL